MGFKAFCKGLADDFLDMLYPEDMVCAVCGDELGAEAKRGFCEGCYRALPLNGGKVCLRCGTSIENLADYCNRCQSAAEERAFTKARSSFIYDGAIPRLVHALKFGGRKYLVKNLAPFMADTLAAAQFPYDLVVPVPLHEKTRKARGFNQAEELARGTLSALGADSALLRPDLLLKTVLTTEQARLASDTRAQNLAGTFLCPDKPAAQGKTILLVDDVLTTGATAHECARTLQKAGAKEVYVLTLASTKERVVGE